MKIVLPLWLFPSLEGLTIGLYIHLKIRLLYFILLHFLHKYRQDNICYSKVWFWLCRPRGRGLPVGGKNRCPPPEE